MKSKITDKTFTSHLFIELKLCKIKSKCSLHCVCLLASELSRSIKTIQTQLTYQIKAIIVGPFLDSLIHTGNK